MELKQNPISRQVTFFIISAATAASISEGRLAFSGFDFYGLVVNPVGAAGVGAGVGWFGLAWLVAASAMIRAEFA